MYILKEFQPYSSQWWKLCKNLGGGGGGGSAKDTRLLGGSGGMLPRKFFKIWIPEIAFVHSEGTFCNKFQVFKTLFQW